jgi:hypothetical protein
MAPFICVVTRIFNTTCPSYSKGNLSRVLTQNGFFPKPASNSLKKAISLRVSEVTPPDTTFFPEPCLTENLHTIITSGNHKTFRNALMFFCLA